MRILIIEDETTLREQLAHQLLQMGYVVDQAANGEEGGYMGREYPVDAAVVDLGLPDLSGMEVIRDWRANGQRFPILILTARGRWQDKVEGLEAGADDYLTKPFQFEELQARLNALIRRTGGWADPQLRWGQVTLDTVAQSVFNAGIPVELTAYEYRVLEYLIQRAGHVVSKSELAEHIYAEDDERDSNVIEVFVGRLRKKLDAGADQPLIETLRGRGYRLNPDLKPR